MSRDKNVRRGSCLLLKRTITNRVTPATNVTMASQCPKPYDVDGNVGLTPTAYSSTG